MLLWWKGKYMNRYKITVNYDKTFIRKANCCVDAMRRLCLQYSWSWHMSMIDADNTRGAKWAKFFIDKEGGINYRENALVEIL